MAFKISVIGLGNILMQDEGVGVHAVKALQERLPPAPGLEFIDGGTAGLDLLPFIEGRDRVLFMDAVNFREEPGYIGMLRNQEIPAFFPMKHSLHHMGLPEVLAAAQLLNVLPPEVCLLGIQPRTIAPGLELSPLLHSRLEELIRRAVAQLREWGVALPGRHEEP
jgi:hydrogenase maturation protease